MISLTQKLKKELLSKLDEEDPSGDPTHLADPRLKRITDIIDQTRQQLKTFLFQSEEEEIDYFKTILPDILSYHLYFKHKVELDRADQYGSPKSRYALYDDLYTMTENFRREHQEFYEYCRNGSSDLDHLYFLRKSPLNREPTYHIHSVTDQTAPTLHCVYVATFIAHLRLEQDMHQRNGNLQIKQGADQFSNLSDLNWTGKQVDFVELIYGLFVTGVINNGKATLKEITEALEKIFSIKLKNIYRVYQDLVNRKSSTPFYADEMKKAIIKKINDMLDK